MEQLAKLVADKTGISQQQAEKAVEIVLNFLKEKLPEPIAGQLDNLVDGADSLDLGKGLDMLGDLFGK